MSNSTSVYADWWERPTTRPTQPSDEHPTSPPEEPTSTPQPTTTQPTPTPRIGGPTPTNPPSNGGGGEGDGEDACAAGKSYVGPYCGWTPRIGGESGGQPGEPQPIVKGLSATGSFDLGLSDIILLSGVLCLLLYAKSKFGKIQRA